MNKTCFIIFAKRKVLRPEAFTVAENLKLYAFYVTQHWHRQFCKINVYSYSYWLHKPVIYIAAGILVIAAGIENK